MLDYAKGGHITVWLPDRVSHNIEGKVQDWNKMVVIKDRLLHLASRCEGFDCVKCHDMRKDKNQFL